MKRYEYQQSVIRLKAAEWLNRDPTDVFLAKKSRSDVIRFQIGVFSKISNMLHHSASWVRGLISTFPFTQIIVIFPNVTFDFMERFDYKNCVKRKQDSIVEYLHADPGHMYIIRANTSFSSWRWLSLLHYNMTCSFRLFIVIWISYMKPLERSLNRKSFKLQKLHQLHVALNEAAHIQRLHCSNTKVVAASTELR